MKKMLNQGPSSGPAQQGLSAAELKELRALARLAFYASLRRRAPQQLVSIPSYVKAVKRHLHLESGNQARLILARIEGFKDWPSLTATMLRQVE